MFYTKQKSKSHCLLLLLALSHTTQSLKLTVSTTGGNASSPLLYGAMFEDINQSGDGGIYAELLRNRAFQGSTSGTHALPNPDLHAYAAVGPGTTLSIDSTSPLSALPHALSVNVPASKSSQYGFLNQGYWGIPVTPQYYHASFFAKGNYKGNLYVKLRSSNGGTAYASQTIAYTGSNSAWTKYTARLVVTKAAGDVNNVFEVTFDGAGLQGGSNKMLFNLISLFPQTYNNRVNGMRPDLMKAMGDLKPSFLRWPGGNSLEGNSVATRWKWFETLGPLENRPGRPGTWSYQNTDGLGILEYLLWTKDLGMTNLYAVWDGLALDGETVTGAALEPYIQEALNSIEFIRGDKSTYYGKKRAALGYPEPFELKYIEIGNEDFLSNGLSTHAQRLTQFYNALRKAYPDIQLIASTDQGLPNPMPEGLWTDIHYYLRPDGFYKSFNLYDNWDRSYPTIVGEYASVEPNDPRQFNAPTNWTQPILDHFFQFPQMIASVSEAIFMIGCERNSDVVKMLAYAPAFQNLNNFQWIPEVISYTADPSKTILSTSYYVQQMFSQNRGTTILPVKSTGGGFDPTFWVASRNDATGQYFVKLAHYSNTPTTITISIPGVNINTATVTTLSAASPQAFNDNYRKWTMPVVSGAQKVADGFLVQIPAYAVVVVALK